MNVVGPADTEGDNGSWETRYCNEQQYFSELQNQIMNDKNQSLKEPNKNLLDNRGCEAGRVRGQTDSRCFSPGTWQSLPSLFSPDSQSATSRQVWRLLRRWSSKGPWRLWTSWGPTLLLKTVTPVSRKPLRHLSVCITDITGREGGHFYINRGQNMRSLKNAKI